MNDLQILLLVLAGFYLWECAQWIRRPGVVFRSWIGEACRAVLPTGVLSNRLGGLIFAGPLPGAGAFFAVQWPPVLFTSETVIAHPDPLDLRDELPAAASVALAWDEIKLVETQRHQLLLNERRFVAAGSPAAARALARLINQLKSRPVAERTAAIEQWLRGTLDTAAVGQRVAAWRNAVWWLGLFCGVEFLLVVFALGWLLRGLALDNIWLPFVVSLIGVNVIATALFFRAHRRLFPDAFEERIQHTAMMAVFPLATIPAPTLLSRALLEGFHPLAVAACLARRSEFEALARRQLRRVGVWLGKVPEGHRPYFQQLDRADIAFLREQKVDVEKLLAPPAANDPDCRSFCPRCEGQFVFVSGHCAACGSIPVEPVAGIQPPNAAAGAGSSRVISSSR